MISVAEAQELVRKYAISLNTEWVSLKDCLGKVLARELRAGRDYPPFNRSAMDGYAVRSVDFSEGKEYIVMDTVFAGDFREGAYGAGEVVKIMTGAPLPDAFDAVVKVEDAEEAGAGRVKFRQSSIRAYENVSRQGEDLKKEELALRPGQKISPAEISLLASLGKDSLEVYRGPVVSVISTGNEIKPVGEPVERHQIHNSNGPVLSAFFQKFGIDGVKEFLVEDDPLRLRSVLEQALKTSEVVVLSGGVSMGEADFVPETLRSLGVEKVFHKVKLKPGKPIWFGKAPGGPVVFGLPGNPFSSQVTFKMFIEPFLRESYGLQALRPLRLPAAFGREKKAALDEFLPAVLVEEEGVSRVKVCSFNGSGDVTATALSEGLVVHPAGETPIRTGDSVAFYPW